MIDVPMRPGRGRDWGGTRRLVAQFAIAWLVGGVAWAQDAGAKEQGTPEAQQPSQTDGAVVGDDQPAAVSDVEAAKTPEARKQLAWKMLSDAVADAKHPQTRIQGLAALGMLRSALAEKMITDAMQDPDLDVRTAAALAAGQTKDRNLTTPLRNLLDDKEPQVVFTAAMTLWKMGDRSGEDILMSVADGGSSAGPTMMHGAEHKIDRDLHDPALLAKMGAMQGAAMLLGPFGFGIAAFEFIHQSGGNVARASAIEQIAQERTAPIHQELLAALADKDVVVRATAAKALVDYHDNATSTALYALFSDPKYPVRLSAAAAYLRTTGTPGPPVTLVTPATARERTKKAHHS